MRTRLWIRRDGVLARDERMALAFGIGSHQPPGSVPASIVWQKMLTAPIRRPWKSVTKQLDWHLPLARDVGQELATGARLSDDDRWKAWCSNSLLTRSIWRAT